MSATEPAIRKGKVAGELRNELPGLALSYCVVEAKPGRSPAGVRRRLRYISDRMHGQRALNLRREPVASAYRVFFRQIGLDPDETRTPVEAAVLERLRAGGFKSRGLVDDALTIATVETGVPVRALDASSLEGELVLRTALAGERLGSGIELEDGTLVFADQRRPVALLFGEIAPEHAVRRATTRLVLCAIQVAGVPEISVEEALWIAQNVLEGVAETA